ncbi:MAG: thioredoxin family protein [Spirochaetota bacterium]
MTSGELRSAIDAHASVLVYMTTTDCGVCKTLRPKVESLLAESFPEMVFIPVHLDQSSSDVARELEVTSVPTVAAFFHGKEHVRKVRVFGIDELKEALDRPYTLLYA